MSQWKNNISTQQKDCLCCGNEPKKIVRDKNNDKHCWKCFQKKFIAHESPWIYNWDYIFSELRSKYGNGVFIQKTFLEYWNKHARLRDALREKGVCNCFVYIKGYLDKDNNTYPIVAGKSSIGVKYKGDVNFSKNYKRGTARYLMHCNGLNWNSKEIIVIPCATKEEALEIERKIQKEYHLLG